MRIFSMLLLCCLLGGCAAVKQPDVPAVTASIPSENPWQPRTFADTPDCFFQVESCALEANGDYRVDLLCQNRSGGSQMFTCEDWCIDGWLVMPFWGEEILPGEAISFQVTVPAQVLARSGITEPKELSFRLRIFSQADLKQNYLVSTPCFLYPTGGKPGYTPIPALYWEEDDMVLVDNSGCTLVLTGFSQNEESYEVDCLLENKTRQSILYRIYGFGFNGLPTEQMWTLELAPGAKCAATMVLELPDLAGYVRQLNLSVYVCRSDEWFGRVWAQEDFQVHPQEIASNP